MTSNDFETNGENKINLTVEANPISQTDGVTPTTEPSKEKVVAGVPRKRGRPKKSPNEAKETIPSSVETSTDTPAKPRKTRKVKQISPPIVEDKQGELEYPVPEAPITEVREADITNSVDAPEGASPPPTAAVLIKPPTPLGGVGMKGKRKQPSDEEEDHAKYPVPVDLRTPQQVELYYRFFKEAHKEHHALRSIFNARVIESMIRGLNPQPDKPLKPEDLVLSPRDMESSMDAIIAKLWNASIGQNNHVIIVGDTCGQPRFYRYTGKTPTYECITESMLYKSIYIWLNELFKGSIPAAVSTKSFVGKLIDQLVIQSVLSEGEFKKIYHKPGIPFNNGYLVIQPQATKLHLVPYGPEIFVEQQPYNYPYKEPIIENGKIILSEETQDLIEILTNYQPDKVNILRVLFRRCLTSTIEGRSFQSGFYISGPAGTGKSSIAEIIKKMVPRDEIQELDRNHNQFSNGQFKNCRVLLISDLKELSPASVATLKVILGRDTLSTQEKYVQGVGLIEPYLTVVMISNIDLDNFWALKHDQAIMDKLLHFRFTAEDVVPAQYQIADFREAIPMYISDLANWAMSAPKEAIESQKRATGYNDMQRKESTRDTSLAGYLCEYFWYHPTNFYSINDFSSHLEKSIEMTGNDSLLPLLKLKKTNLISIVKGTMDQHFHLKVEEKRRSTKDEAGFRPLGIMGLLPKAKKDDFPPVGAKVIDYPVVTNFIDLPGVYDAKPTIAWFQQDENTVKQSTRAYNLYKRAMRLAEASSSLNINSDVVNLKPNQESVQDTSDILDIDPSDE